MTDLVSTNINTNMEGGLLNQLNFFDDINDDFLIHFGVKIGSLTLVQIAYDYFTNKRKMNMKRIIRIASYETFGKLIVSPILNWAITKMNIQFMYNKELKYVLGQIGSYVLLYYFEFNRVPNFMETLIYVSLSFINEKFVAPNIEQYIREMIGNPNDLYSNSNQIQVLMRDPLSQERLTIPDQTYVGSESLGSNNYMQDSNYEVSSNLENFSYDQVYGN